MSTVYYSPLKNKPSVSPLSKISKLLVRAGAKDIYERGNIVALKVHFGEFGNTAFLRPIYLRPAIELLKNYGAKPYLTDTNTLYTGMRINSVDHIHNANLNGFGYSTLQTPIIVADGLRGEEMRETPVPGGQLIKHAKLATGILNADALLVITHFKGHDFTGFGGSIKNLSMGCAARAGKLAMHSVSRPCVNPHKCTACGRCKSVCQANAIKISHTAAITEECTGCVRCVGACPEEAISPKFDNSIENLQKMLTEYAAAVLAAFEKPVICLNILMSMVPSCDCMPGNDEPAVKDLGFMASTDPVALDRASLDLIMHNCGGENPFAAISGVSGETQFSHAEAIGLGNSKYKLEKID
ncbi:MAG: DUF362 domain-containing protein [Deferribacteraceae bacterium]|jgi:uncharacterized Fe-S center protein|nr:DUF362 domain-containing protein [Deferribacteraceae bacterium]